MATQTKVALPIPISCTEPQHQSSAEASPMTVVIKGLPAEHSLSGCMGEYVEQDVRVGHRPSFVGGRCNGMVLFFDGDGWCVKCHQENDLMLWSARDGTSPHLTSHGKPWIVFDHTKMPAPSFHIRQFKKRVTMLEVTCGQGSAFGKVVEGKYNRLARIHNARPVYIVGTTCKAIWFEAGFGWCIGDEGSIGTHICAFHANDFAPTPDAVQSSWMVQTDPIADHRVQVVLASAKLPTCPAGQQSLPANNAALQVAVVGMTEGCNGLYKIVQHMQGDNALYKCTAADGNSVVWYNMDRGGEWCIGPQGSNGRLGCIAFAADPAPASSPLASELTWYEPAWEPYSSIRVTKSKKKHTKVIEVKGFAVPCLLNGKYRQQALVVDGKPTFKGGQDSKHVIWYSERTGEWRIGPLGFVGTSAHLVHAEDTAATPNTVKSTWYARLGTQTQTLTDDTWVDNPCIKVILPSVKAAEQEVPRQMQLKMPEVLAAEEKRCLGCGHQYTSVAEVVFHEECMHHHCVCCHEGLGDTVCAVCMEE
jgi:hypothetical protein